MSKLDQVSFQQLQQELKKSSFTPSTRKKNVVDNPLQTQRREETLKKTEINKKLVQHYLQQQFRSSFTSEKSYLRQVERDQTQQKANQYLLKKQKIPKQQRSSLESKRQETEQVLIQQLQKSKRYQMAQDQLSKAYSNFISC